MAATDIMSLEDQARLELTLRTREKIILELTKEGKMPQEITDRDFLMKALDGMDRTVLSKAKIKSDDNAAQTQAQTSKVIAELLLRVGNVPSNTRRKEMIDIGDVEVTDLVEGETHIGVLPVKYREIVGPDA